MSTVDYFVAPAMILSSEAHRAYSEQLVRLPGAGSILPTEIESLPDDAGPDVLPGARKYDFGAFFLYSKYRYAAVIFDDISQLHPGMDNLLRGILRRVPTAQILLVQRPTPRSCRMKSTAFNASVHHETRGNDATVLQDNDFGLGRIVERIRGDGSAENVDGQPSAERVLKTPGYRSKPLYSQTRIRHVAGLTRSDYYSLLASIQVVLDPATEDGGGFESALLSSLESMMIGTPVVTLEPNEATRGWDKVQPTSSSAALIRAVDTIKGDVGDDASASSRCLARTLEDYVFMAAALLEPANRTAHRDLQARLRNNTRAWIIDQNEAVKMAWVELLERLGRPYAEWRTAVMVDAAKRAKVEIYKERSRSTGMLTWPDG